MSLDIYLIAVRPTTVFARNITHNLNVMAKEAGLYEALWRPEEIPVEFAKDLIPFLEAGLTKLLANPGKFRAMNPPNGWGTYEGFREAVSDYLEACLANPDAKIEVSR